MKTESNARRVIASSEVTAVEVCGCGSAYLSIGPVCLAMQPSALVELRATLNQALRVMVEEQMVGARAGIGVPRPLDEN